MKKLQVARDDDMSDAAASEFSSTKQTNDTDRVHTRAKRLKLSSSCHRFVGAVYRGDVRVCECILNVGGF